MVIFIPSRVSFEYKGDTFKNTEFNDEVFLKGGSAREALMAYMGGDLNPTVIPRDLDIWVPEWLRYEEGYWVTDDDFEWDWSPLNSCPVIKHWVREDSRYYESDSCESPLEVARELLSLLTDINLNKVVIGKEGIYAHVDAIKGVVSKSIWRDSKEKPGKRAIRAHFMAVRYGYEVIDGTYLPNEHTYYGAVRGKAVELGILDKWNSYLTAKGIDPEGSILKGFDIELILVN